MKDKPLSIYIHFPWCEVKCPYCDFNSHVLKHKKISTHDYILKLIEELNEKKQFFHQTEVGTVFFGGGTPSLMTANQINFILDEIFNIFNRSKDCEITIEMNPESVTKTLISSLEKGHVNRISLGVQSFNDKYLQKLGRIHDAGKAQEALTHICDYFENINVDLMYALPDQSIQDAMDDIETVFYFPIKHLSWYQLTIEPQTAYYKKIPPGLPKENEIYDIELYGKEKISKNGFNQYEISAFAKDNHVCKHNVNYWLFGDYMGLGAGAHSKRNFQEKQFRSWNHKKPDTYFSNLNRPWEQVNNKDIIFEFFLNRLRLTEPFTPNEFESNTYHNFAIIHEHLLNLEQKGLMASKLNGWQLTKLGNDFYNDVVSSFIEEVRK
ncbi:MAG: radical SAM family heme chaperone HemW [Pseudomonadota bacterium]|nr:radical SAM family heme chaperone HemW [Pseudomonadota bacterium]